MQKIETFLSEEIYEYGINITWRYGQHNFMYKISAQYHQFWGSARTMKFTTVIEAKTGILDPLV